MGSLHLSRVQVVGAERVGQQCAQGNRSGFVIDQEIASAVLVEQLAAAPAGHEDLAARIRHRDGQQTAPAARNQVTDEYTFGTQAQTV